MTVRAHSAKELGDSGVDVDDGVGVDDVSVVLTVAVLLVGDVTVTSSNQFVRKSPVILA